MLFYKTVVAKFKAWRWRRKNLALKIPIPSYGAGETQQIEIERLQAEVDWLKKETSGFSKELAESQVGQRKQVLEWLAEHYADPQTPEDRKAGEQLRQFLKDHPVEI